MIEKNEKQGNLSLIDTDTLIFILRNNKNAIERSKEYQQKFGSLNISDLTYYECLRGYQCTKAIKKLEVFLKLVDKINTIPLNRNIYNKASEIYAELRIKGFPSGEIDILIAATALENDMTLVTNNTKHYIKIREYFDLRIDNWID
ncbi:MAG: type II toxin-antitoxin system VapC family toxin [Bacteroidales bacterium]|nr:type II toxin-antitoxin system VapC family toxin [Bacteroidales bacterium]MCF8458667.1 type II toxin-antitoxin system VapC family toxin [Bacteroidales bacterium]